ncbi:MAG: hypothetical protein LYZ69_01625 [Nitrososphaerales archaeon]|nr:hypothetical protein [Nitrososphaerales archaeon]
MATSLRLGSLAAISAVGVAYSGYLSYIALATGQPACETYYFGYPSCFYGFILYALIFIVGLAALLVYKNRRAIAVVGLSVMGVGFSAFLTGYILTLTSCVKLYIFGVPPCVMGLGMFALVLILALSLLRS